MPRDATTSVSSNGAPPREFWENDLEVGVDHTLVGMENGLPEDWISKRTRQQVHIMCLHYGFGRMSAGPFSKRHLVFLGSQLAPYLLVSEFAKYKSKAAIVEFAKGILPQDTLDICRKNDEDFDTLALCFALYHRNWSDLRLLFHLDKIHRSGFARMMLAGRARRPEQTLEEFLQPRAITEVLEDFDQASGDGRTSEFRNVISHDGHCLVFLRRCERPDLVLRARCVMHGYRPEWIILDFSEGAKRVAISSSSIAEPLEIADRIASSYFGKACRYENESQVTHTKQLERFLEILKSRRSEELPLVELVIHDSPLDGSPKLKLSDPGLNWIGRGIAHFEHAIGGLLAEIDSIESIKVYYRHKRVSLIFERIKDADDQYVVRYSDHRLNAWQRREFEQYMRENHGITVLSTEKRSTGYRRTCRPAS